MIIYVHSGLYNETCNLFSSFFNWLFDDIQRYFSGDNQPAYNHDHDGPNVTMKKYFLIYDHII
jgi:hypothetical protein